VEERPFAAAEAGELSHSLVFRPTALFEVKGKISVDTGPRRFIIILIR